MRREGLVRTRREAQTIYYGLASDEAAAMMSLIYRLFCRDTRPVPAAKHEPRRPRWPRRPRAPAPGPSYGRG